MRNRTQVTMVIKAVFEGDYHDPKTCADELEDWLRLGCEDRDDLRILERGNCAVTTEPLTGTEDDAGQPAAILSAEDAAAAAAWAIASEKAAAERSADGTEDE